MLREKINKGKIELKKREYSKKKDKNIHENREKEIGCK